MVGTPGTADSATVPVLETRLHRAADRFLAVDPTRGSVTVNYRALAALVAEILTEQVAALRPAGAVAARLRTGLCAVLSHDPAAYPGDEQVMAELRELAGEARVRENEVISLGCEVEKLERALSEAARDSETAARFVTTMLPGGGG